MRVEDEGPDNLIKIARSFNLELVGEMATTLLTVLGAGPVDWKINTEDDEENPFLEVLGGMYFVQAVKTVDEVDELLGKKVLHRDALQIAELVRIPATWHEPEDQDVREIGKPVFCELSAARVIAMDYAEKLITAASEKYLEW